MKEISSRQNKMNLKNLLNTSLPFEFEVDASYEDCLAMLQAYRSAKPGFWGVRKFNFATPIRGNGIATVEASFNGASLDAQIEGNGEKTLVSGYADYESMILLATAIAGFIVSCVFTWEFGSIHWFFIFFAVPLGLAWFVVIINRQTLLGEFQKIFSQPKPF